MQHYTTAKKIARASEKRGRNRRPTRIGDGAIEIRALAHGSSSVAPALVVPAFENVETVDRALAMLARHLTPSSLL